MSKDLTVLIIGILGLISAALGFAATTQNRHVIEPQKLILLFTTEIMAAAFCLFFVVFLARRLALRKLFRAANLKNRATISPEFLSVSSLKFDRSGFLSRFWKRRKFLREV